MVDPRTHTDKKNEHKDLNEEFVYWFTGSVDNLPELRSDWKIWYIICPTDKQTQREKKNVAWFSFVKKSLQNNFTYTT